MRSPAFLSSPPSRGKRLAPGVYETDSGFLRAYGYLKSLVTAGRAELLGEDFPGGGVLAVLVRVLPPKGAKGKTNPHRGRRRNPEEQGAYEDWKRDAGNVRSAALEVYPKEWRPLWWREVVQNSYDGGARNITLDVNKITSNNTYVVTCIDDGTGMARDVMRDKFFVDYATTKTGGASMGGFGIAKELILVPWVSYEVHSRNYLVRGRAKTLFRPIGAQDFVQELPQSQYLQGTRVSVVMEGDGDKHTTIAHAIEWLSSCNIPGVKFHLTSRVDGVPEPEFGDLLRTFASDSGKHQDLANLGAEDSYSGNFLIRITDLYWNKTKGGVRKVAERHGVVSDDGGAIYVRVRSPRDPEARLTMFEIPTGISQAELPGDLFLDVKPGVSSKQALTANRADFSDQHVKSSISSIIRNLADAKERALKQQMEEESSVASYGTGFFVQNADNQAKAQMAAMDSLQQVKEEARDEIREKWLKRMKEAEAKGKEPPPAPPEKAEDSAPPETSSEELKKAAEKMAETVDDLPDAAPEDKTKDSFRGATKSSSEETKAAVQSFTVTGISHLEAIAKQAAWQPNFLVRTEFEDEHGNPKPVLKCCKWLLPAHMNDRFVDLAKVWTAFVRAALQCVACDRPWGVGFIISPDAKAAYMAHSSLKTSRKHSQSYGSGKNFLPADKRENWVLVNPVTTRGGAYDLDSGIVNVEEDGKLNKAAKLVCDVAFAELRKRGPGGLSEQGLTELTSLFASAVHEISHFADGAMRHDESFAIALTKNMRATGRMWQNLPKIAYAALKQKGMRTDFSAVEPGEEVATAKRESVSKVHPALARLAYLVHPAVPLGDYSFFTDHYILSDWLPVRWKARRSENGTGELVRVEWGVLDEAGADQRGAERIRFDLAGTREGDLEAAFNAAAADAFALLQGDERLWGAISAVNEFWGNIFAYDDGQPLTPGMTVPEWVRRFPQEAAFLGVALPGRKPAGYEDEWSRLPKRLDNADYRILAISVREKPPCAAYSAEYGTSREGAFAVGEYFSLPKGHRVPADVLEWVQDRGSWNTSSLDAEKVRKHVEYLRDMVEKNNGDAPGGWDIVNYRKVAVVLARKGADGRWCAGASGSDGRYTDRYHVIVRDPKYPWIY